MLIWGAEGYPGSLRGYGGEARAWEPRPFPHSTGPEWNRALCTGHILRRSPPIVMDEDTLLKGLDIIDEAIGETEKELLS